MREQRGWIHWGFAAAAVAVYAAFYVWVVRRQSYVPYFDQASYVSRVYHIQDAIERKGFWSPSAYFSGPFSGRPPLLLAPAAWLLGRDADPRSMALVWLALRLAALVAGLAVLARVTRSSRFVPLAALVALGSGFFLQADQHLYLMDEAFGCFALLVTACLVWELETPGVASALALPASIVLLILVKPAGLLFALPVFAAAGASGIGRAIRSLAGREERARALRWAAAWAVCPIAFALLLKTGYWRAAMNIWHESWNGWWDTSRHADQIPQFAILMIPPWLCVLAPIAAWRGRARADSADGRARRGLRGWTLAALGLVIVSWFVYVTWLGFSVDERFPASTLPVTAAVAATLASRHRRLFLAALAIAATFFVANVGIAGGFGRPGALQWVQWVTGPLAHRARRVPEIGERPACRAIRDEIERTGATSATVVTLICDDYVDYESLNLAMRFESGNRWSSIRFEPVPFADDVLDLRTVGSSEWFVTKRPHDTIDLAHGALAVLKALDRVLTDEQSPLRARVTRVGDFALRQPEDANGSLFHAQLPFRLRDETMTLWRLDPPNEEEIAAARTWLRATRDVYLLEK